jgi:hypothetical protein
VDDQRVVHLQFEPLSIVVHFLFGVTFVAQFPPNNIVPYIWSRTVRANKFIRNNRMQLLKRFHASS